MYVTGAELESEVPVCKSKRWGISKESYRDCKNCNHGIGQSCFELFMDNLFWFEVRKYNMEILEVKMLWKIH